MIRTFDTIVTRTMLVSLIGITLVHLLSLWTYEQALDRELSIAHQTRLAERLIAIKRSVMLVPANQRESVAHELSGGSIEAHWSASKAAIAGAQGMAPWQGLGEQISALTQDHAQSDLVIGTSVDADPHEALISMRLPDGSWLNFNLFAAGPPRASGHGTILSTSLMALGVILLSLLVARWLSRPISAVANAVSVMTPGNSMAAVPVNGPKEVRELAAAFNAMQDRINDLIRRRTQALAAVSHDLRTPLTRLKLRFDILGDADLGQAAAEDIAEMEHMIDDTLAYLRGEEKAEPPRALDLVALLDTIVDNARDAGHDCTLTAPAHLTIEGRLLGLRRAFGNLVGNAARFGDKVEASVLARTDHIEITIEDNGPGIPDAELSAVLEPFVRLDHSRNRESGGVGLGLTIAKANIEADGGTLTLSNRPGGGLRAIATLPKWPA